MLIIIIIVSSLITCLSTYLILVHIWKNKIIKDQTCPFKNCCMIYDETETKKAIKRVLTLMINNDVSEKEIRKEIEASIPNN